MAEYIDVTPTWSGILPIILTALRDATPEGQRMAGEEIRRMAKLADEYAELVKEFDELRALYEASAQDVRTLISVLIQIEGAEVDPIEAARAALNRMTCAGDVAE